MKLWKKFSILAATILLCCTWRPAFATVVNALYDFIEVAAPATPVTGLGRIYFDSTNHLLSDKNSSGTVHHTVATTACSGGTPVVGNINADGSVTCAAGGGGAGGSTINLLQYNAVRGNPVTTLAFLNNVTSTDLLVVCGGWEGSTAANPSAIDTVGTVYSVLVGTNGAGGGNGNAACLAGAAAATGSNTVTVTWPATSSFEGIYVAEWKNVTTTLDASVASAGLANASFRTVNMTTATAGDLILMFVDGNSSGGTLSCWGASLFLDQAQSADSGGWCTLVQNSAGFISNGAQNTSGANSFALVALKHS